MTRFRYVCADHGVCWLKRRWDSNALGQAAAELDGVWPFPRGISPSDIDGFMEYGGRFIFIETKEAGASMTRGQELAFERLSHFATVLVQECSPSNEDAVTRVRVCTGGVWQPWKTMDRLGRDRLVQQWFAHDDLEAQAA